MRCIGPRAKDADLWILIWEELRRCHQEGILVEVEHVKAHRTRKEMQQMSLFERFIAEGNAKADELPKEGTMLDGGLVAEVRASTVQREREDVSATLQYAASFHCLVEEWKDCKALKPQPREKWIFVDKKREATKHQTEWCAAACKYRCMRCGRGSKYMKMEGKCTGPKYLAKNLGRWCKRHMG